MNFCSSRSFSCSCYTHTIISKLNFNRWISFRFFPNCAGGNFGFSTIPTIPTIPIVSFFFLLRVVLVFRGSRIISFIFILLLVFRIWFFGFGLRIRAGLAVCRRGRAGISGNGGRTTARFFFQAHPVRHHAVPGEGVEVEAAFLPEGIAAHPPAVLRVVVAVVVIDEARLFVTDFTAPLHGAGDCAGEGLFPEGGVVVLADEPPGDVEHFRDVLVLVMPEEVGLVVFHQREGTRRPGGGRVPQEGVVHGTAVLEVQGGHLHVPAVEVAFMQDDDGALERHFFGMAAPFGVVAAFDDGGTVRRREADGTVPRVVEDVPDTGGSQNFRLVAVRIVGRGEAFRCFLKQGVLVQGVGRVGRGGSRLRGRLPVADVVVSVLVGVRPQGGPGEFAAAIVGEGMGRRRTGAALLRTGGEAGEIVIGVGTLRQGGGGRGLPDPGGCEQVAVRLVGTLVQEASGERYAPDEFGAGQVIEGEALLQGAGGEDCRADPAVRRIADGRGEQAGGGRREAVFIQPPVGVVAVEEAVVGSIRREGLPGDVPVVVILHGAGSGAVRHARDPAEVVVRVGDGRRGGVRRDDGEEFPGQGVVGAGGGCPPDIGGGDQTVHGAVGHVLGSGVRVVFLDGEVPLPGVYPGGRVPVGAPGGVRDDGAGRHAEGRQRGEVAVGVIPAADGLGPGAVYGGEAGAGVVLVAGGEAQGVGDEGGQARDGIIGRGGFLPGAVPDEDDAPGGIALDGDGNAAAIRLRHRRTGRGEGARGCRHGSGVVLAVGGEAVLQADFRRDGGGGNGAPPRALSVAVVLRPLDDDVAVQIRRDGLAFQRGAEFRNQLRPRPGEGLAGGVIRGGGHNGVHPVGTLFIGADVFHDAGILRGGLGRERHELAGEFAHGVVFVEEGDAEPALRDELVFRVVALLRDELHGEGGIDGGEVFTAFSAEPVGLLAAGNLGGGIAADGRTEGLIGGIGVGDGTLPGGSQGVQGGVLVVVGRFLGARRKGDDFAQPLVLVAVRGGEAPGVRLRGQASENVVGPGGRAAHGADVFPDGEGAAEGVPRVGGDGFRSRRRGGADDFHKLAGGVVAVGENHAILVHAAQRPAASPFRRADAAIAAGGLDQAFFPVVLVTGG